MKQPEDKSVESQHGSKPSTPPGWNNASDDGRSYPKSAAQSYPLDFNPMQGPMPPKA
jgi:hypothetical protein